LVKGIGDDAAVIRPRGAAELWALTTDLLVEEVDFRRDWLEPGQLGYKALAVNLSDLAAMGVRPTFCTVGLSLPRDITGAWIRRFYDGLNTLAQPRGVSVIGGDLSASPAHIQIAVTALGQSRGRRVLYRSGGKPGHSLFVTGTLGLAAAGLKILQSGTTANAGAACKLALKRHCTPEPRCEVGLWLAQSGIVGAMMDLSDGLSADLPRLCEASGVGAEVHASRLPLFSESSRWGCDPLALALHGGEDFELLFSVSPRRVRTLEATYPVQYPPIQYIGDLTAKRGIYLISEEGGPRRRLPRLGFDHFAAR
jgi:thiamine-monophosphate kinase